MGYSKQAQEYRKSAVNGASPLELVIMLYDGALKSMAAGREAVVAGELEKQNEHLQKAQRIVFELMSCLDMGRGGEVASNLLALYGYVINELVAGNVNDDPAAVDRAMQVMADLRDGWVSIHRAVTSRAEEERQAEVRLAA
ncbi:MAG: flagellar export chaperone FliS [Fimbriimonadaceae bacterium]